MKSIHKFIFFLLFFFVFITRITAGGSGFTVLDQNFSHEEITNYDFYVDSSNSKKIEDIIESKGIDFNFTPTPLSINYQYDTYWVKLDFDCQKTDIYHLQTHYRLLNELNYNVVKGTKIIDSYESGNINYDHQNNFYNGMNHYKYKFIKGEQYNIYIKARNKISSIRLPFSIQSDDYYRKNITISAVKWSLFGGAMLLLFLLGLFFYITHKDITYLYYSLYNLCTATILLNNKGYFPFRFTESLPGFAYYDENVIFGYLILFGIFNFTIRYLEDTIENNKKNLHLTINLFITITFFLFCLFTVEGDTTKKTLAVIFNFCTMAILLYIIYLILTGVFKRSKAAYYYTFAITPFVILLFIARFKKLFLLQEMAYSNEAFSLAVIFDSFVMLAGLTLKFKHFKEEKERLLQEKNDYQKDKLNLSKKLHDTIGAQFTLLKLGIDDAKKSSENNKLNTLSSFLSNAITDLRNSIWSLNQEEGITLEQIKFKTLDVISFIKNSQDKIKISFRNEGSFDKKVETLFSINLLNTINEAINNAIKHSNCSKIDILIENDENRLQVTLKDNGIGFNPKNNSNEGNGLKNIKERIKEIEGNLKIVSNNKGTTLIVTKNWI